MLCFPKSVLSNLSDYREVFVDGETLLTSVLDGESACHFVKLDLIRVHSLGWKSAEARALYRSACEQMIAWCVAHEHYLNNLAFEQRIGFLYESRLACTPVDRRRIEKPPQTLMERIFGTRRRVSSFQSDWSRYSYTPRLDGDFPNWAATEHMFEDGELALIDAPICLDSNVDGEPTPYLCDFPPVLRRDDDLRIPLHVTAGALPVLKDALGIVSRWHPFCRLLGMVRMHPNGTAFQVLQVAMRAPSFNARRYGADSWGDELVQEVQSTERKSLLNETLWLSECVHAFENLPSGNPAMRIPAEPYNASAQTLEELRAHLHRNASDTEFHLTRLSSSPYEGQDAFWCAIAVILAGWPRRFALTDVQRAAVLAEFDKTYDADWRRVASWLDRLGLIRYTPHVMDNIRDAIASPTRHD